MVLMIRMKNVMERKDSSNKQQKQMQRNEQTKQQYTRIDDDERDETRKVNTTNKIAAG